MATKKLYIKLADMMADLYATGTPAVSQQQVEKSLIKVLSADNSRFDAVKFQDYITKKLLKMKGLSDESDS